MKGVALAAALFLLLAAVTATVSGPATAAVPIPSAGEAVVQMYVGDQRTSSTGIGPLPGATFGLFRSDPSASIDAHDGFTDVVPDFTCTSDGQGDCSFVVPVGDGPGQVQQNTRLWAAAVSGPTGYYANPYWQTAPLSGGVRSSLRHVFQTPPLVAGQTYRAGSDWVRDPGLQTSPPSTVADYARRVASGGVTPLSRFNPGLPERCGLKVALVVDLSSSVSGHVGELKGALDAFVNALRGTPSQAALFTFGTDSPANGYGTNTSLRSVATSSEANAFKQLYASWGNPPTNYTNWDRGLAAAAAVNASDPDASNHFDLAVFVTDGNPTVYGPDPLTSGGQLKDRNSGYTRFRELGNGLASANLLKSQGTRILAVGVGDGVSDSGAKYNLRTVSGRNVYDGDNVLDADYFQTSDYLSAGASLRDVVLASCAPSVSVIKRIVPFDGTIDDAYAPSSGWVFSAEPTTDGATVTPASGTTDPGAGGIAFDLDFDAEDSPAGVRIEETNQAGYTPLPDETRCVNKTTGDDVDVPVDQEGSTAFSVPVGLQDAVSCIVYNRAPDVTEASVVVHKRWRVVSETGTQDLPNGIQPSDLQSQLSLGGPGGAQPSPQGWGAERAGYRVGSDSSVRISEDVSIALPGCRLTDATLEAGPPDASFPGSGEELDTNAPTTAQPLTAGTNEWTMTNRVVCRSTLKLHKDVASGNGDPSWWNLRAIGPGGALPGPDGAAGTPQTTGVEVSPDVAYQLAETSTTDDHAALHYLQSDERTRPLQYPQSSGSWACATVGAGTPRDPSVSAEGAVYVPLGMYVECTAVNQTAYLTVVKQVVGGDAQPGDFTFHVEPIAPVVPGGHGHDIPGAADPGSTITVRPTQHYRLTEVGAADDYQLTDLECVSGARDLDPADFYIEPGGTARCEAINTHTTWTATKSSDPASGSRVEPGDTITYTVTARQLDGGPTDDAEVTDDLSDVLDDATLVPGSLRAEAGDAALDGSALTWHIPQLRGSPTLTYQVRVDDDAWNTTLRNALTELTTPAGPDGQHCEGVAGQPAGCDQTEHRTPPQSPGSSSGGLGLPDTGGPYLWLLSAGIVVTVGGIALVRARTRRT